MHKTSKLGIAPLIAATLSMGWFACGGARHTESDPVGDDDRDGVAAADDRCPNEPADRDGFEDDDGCPQTQLVDRDGDGVADEFDECPEDKETFDGIEDEDGCPEKHRIVVTDTQIEILDVIYFERDESSLVIEAFPMLDAIAATFMRNPDLVLVEIQGHAEVQEGTDDEALRLSEARAEAVIAYLVDHGVSRSRLVSKGYGKTVPVDTRDTAGARAKNRRVDLLILKRGD